MFAARPKPSKNSKKKKNETIIIGGPDNNPFGGLGKLLNGFCDPHQGAEDDDSTIVSYVPYGDKSREVFLVEGPGLSYGVNNGDSTNGLQDKPDPSILDKAATVEEEKKAVEERSLPVLKASNAGPKLRRRRGLEVAIVGIVFVMGTLFALHRLGYEFDLKVVETQWKSGIDIVFSENDGTGVPEKMKKWIDIAFKKEPVEDVELKKAQDEENNEAEGHEGLESQDIETKTEVVEDESTEDDAAEDESTEAKKEPVEAEKAEGHESLESQDGETETEVVEDESTKDDVVEGESTEDKLRKGAVKLSVLGTGDTLDSDKATMEAQAKLEEELLAEILGEEL